MQQKYNKSSQRYPSQQNSKTLLVLLTALGLPLVIIFTLYPWFCHTKMKYLDIWIFCLFGCWLVYQFIGRTNEKIIIIETYFDGFIVLIPCLLVLLCLPLPAHALRLLASKLFLDTKWIATQASWIFDPGYGWSHISHWPQQSIQLSIHGIACLLIFFLIIHTVKTRFQLNVLIYSLLGSLIAGTLAGCLFFYDWSETKSFLSVNHHMALFLNMIIPLSLGVILTLYKKTRKPVFKTFSYSLKVSLQNLIKGEQAILTRMALVFLFLIGFLLFARPFGLKMLGLSITLLLGGMLLTVKPKLRSQFFIWAMAGLALGVYALISNAVSTSESMNPFLLDIFNDYYLTGVGPGALPVVWPRYSNIEMNDQFFHISAWIKFLAEYGMMGMSFWISAIVVFLIRMNNMWHNRQSLFNVGWGLGIMMALIATGLFGIGYSFGNPYIVMPAVSAFAACGFLVLHAGHHSSRQAFFYRNIAIKRKSWYALTSAGLILFLLFIGIIQLILSPDTNKVHQFQTLTELERIRTLRNNKYNADLWFQMAKLYNKQDKDAVTYMRTSLSRADICYEIACYLAPKNNFIVFDAARYWVWRSQLLNDEHISQNKNVIPNTRAQAIDIFQKKFRNVLDQQPDKYKSVVDAIWQWYKDDSIVLDAIPDKPKYLKQNVLEYVLLQKNN